MTGQVEAAAPAAMLFDAGQTLLFSRTGTAEMAGTILLRHGHEVDGFDLRRAMRSADQFIASRWHVGPWWLHETAVRDLFTAGYREGLTTVSLLQPHADEIRQLAEEIYQAYADSEHWSLYADVRPTLDALQAMGLPLGIVSDWGESLPLLLHQLGIAGAFQTVVVSSRLGLGKPDPGLFAMAVSRLGVRPEQVWYIGDTYSKDVLGARAAGLHPILIDRDGLHGDLDCRVIRSLTELLPHQGGGQRQAAAL